MAEGILTLRMILIASSSKIADEENVETQENKGITTSNSVAVFFFFWKKNSFMSESNVEDFYI